MKPVKIPTVPKDLGNQWRHVGMAQSGALRVFRITRFDKGITRACLSVELALQVGG